MYLLTEWENIWHKVIAGQLHREPNIFPPTRINSHSVEVCYRMIVLFFEFFWRSEPA